MRYRDYLARMAVERLDVLEELPERDPTRVAIYCSQWRHGHAYVYKRTGRCSRCGRKVRVAW